LLRRRSKMPQKTKSRHSLGQSATMPAPVSAQFSICAASPDEGAVLSAIQNN
jgi:hypothetical protein